MTSRTRFYAEFSPRMRVIALLTGVFIAFATPMTYLAMSLQDEKTAADRLGQEVALKIRETVRINPELWKFSVVKFMQVFDEMENREIAFVRIYDDAGALLDGADFGHRYLLRSRGSAAIVYNNTVFGRVEVDKVADTALYSSLTLFFLFSLIGAGVAFLLYRFPSAIVVKAETNIEDMIERLNAEIAERLKKEQELAASIEEKDILLREIHHRVKNNLQLVASLLNLRMNRLERGDTWDLLENIKHKIHSMAHVHEHLYRSDTLTKIDMRNYLDTFVEQDAGLSEGTAVAYSVEADGVFLSIDRAMPIGLIVSELVMNARKYAFTGRANGRIAIALRKKDGNRLALSVADDGVGLPDGQVPGGNSLGYLLIKALSTQLGGTLKTESSDGLTVTVDDIEE